MDPIEKKPLYHFHPGAAILSVGQNGCNFDCAFCQNWHISRSKAPDEPLAPDDLVRRALEMGSSGIAYTYNEPLVAFEYVLDAASAAAKAGLVNVLVTNGYISKEPLAELLPFIDAMNVDLKSTRDDFYRRLCGGTLAPVLDTLVAAFKKVHLEVTNLVIPGENDEDEDFCDLRDWLHENLGPEVPIHISAYHPAHRMSAPPTPLATLERAREILAEKMAFIYIGNVRTAKARDTRCRTCDALLVEREGYRGKKVHLADDGCCASCGAAAGFVLARAAGEGGETS